MQLEPLYQATFSTPESWSVELEGSTGTEGQSFLIAEGRCGGRLSARLRAANYPRRRVDGTLLPDFRGVLETDDGAAILFSWRGYARRGAGGARELVGSVSHVTEDERYSWLNDQVCPLVGEVRPRTNGTGFDVVLDVSVLIWEPLGRGVLAGNLDAADRPEGDPVAVGSVDEHHQDDAAAGTPEHLARRLGVGDRGRQGVHRPAG